MKNKDNDKQEVADTDKSNAAETQTTSNTFDWGADELKPETDAEGNDIVESGLGIDE